MKDKQRSVGTWTSRMLTSHIATVTGRVEGYEFVAVAEGVLYRCSQILSHE